MLRSIALHLICSFVLLVGCGAAPADDDTSASAATLGIVDEFPPRESIDFAMDSYLRDPAGARAQPPTSLGDFFGQGTTSMNIDQLRVELLKPNPRFSDKPIAFLHAHFHGGDGYWNDRFKDVQLFRLVDSTGTSKNPFPEAAHVASEGAAIVRVWNEYHPVHKGAPPGLEGEALAIELARISVWSYVSGNVDGVANNGGNGGFARFKDASGRMFWRGVLIDEGAAWNTPPDANRPWTTNLLGEGPVERAHIAEDVINSLVQIARATADELAQRSRFEHVDEGARDIVRGIQARAREVLDHYGVTWKTAARVIPLRPRGAPLCAAA